ncbi:MAG: YicC/YloC family endoribonuclease [Acidobacteriota bacterium]
MTVRSMTGFGRSRGPVGPDRSAEIVVRSVNSRYLDLTVKTRETEASLEPPLRRVFSRHLHRGKVEVALRLKRSVAGNQEITIDEALLEALLSRLRELSSRYPIQATLTLRELLAIPQLLTIESTTEQFSAEELAALEALAEEAARALVAMRESEGAGIAAEISPRIASLRQKASGLEARREEIARNLAATLRERVRALFADVALDPGRLEQEAALAADRADVAEELQRLRGHLDQFDALLARPPEAVGKTMDFLTQEILRELNTLGSKSRDLTSTREILEMKSQIEKIREQVQNVE